MDIRVGQGYDVHRLAEGRKCIICGVEIPHEKGLLGHSDADVALHALSDAMLGAAGMGDIGRHFPDNDDTFKDADSRVLLRRVLAMIKSEGYKVVNADITIVAQKPKMMPYIEIMKKNVAADIETPYVNIKATTTEKLGFEGRGEGISALAAVLLKKDETGRV